MLIESKYKCNNCNQVNLYEEAYRHLDKCGIQAFDCVQGC